MVESTEMRIFNEETSAKILNTVMNAALSEQIEMRVSRWDIASNVISIFFRLFAVLFNVNLAYEYYTRGEFFFFRMTLCFIFIPAFISILMSITLWARNLCNWSFIFIMKTSTFQTLRRLKERGWCIEKEGICQSIVLRHHISLHPAVRVDWSTNRYCQNNPQHLFFRFMQSLIYQVKSLRAEKNKDYERQRHYYKLMVMEESDVSLIRIIECFLGNFINLLGHWEHFVSHSI